MSDETREQRQAKQCRAKHPTNDSVVPCCLSPGHDSDHWSSTGCPGSAMLWPATVCVRLDGLADRLANWFMIDRRSNPDMRGPNPVDRRRAEDLVSLLQSLAVQ
jgi:hypothetical protein